MLLACAHAETRTLRGWLSDEACARSRANSGVFANTNPECARKCVAEGKKIVLIDPEHKAVLDIDNQDAAREQVGNLVEVSATPDASGKTLHLSSVKFLEAGVVACDRPKPKK
jgi:hypothetical protein